MRHSKIIAASLAAFAIAVPAYARSYQECGVASYVNSRGHCVRRPVHAYSAPAGASAKCRDDTYSFSESRRGTCPGHGGVASWLLG